MWHRFDVRWTPTVLVLDANGKEVRRVEGFLPIDEFLAQLELAAGDLAVDRKAWSEAEEWYKQIVDQLPNTDAAPEALYWSGVARYSGSHEVAALQELGRAFKQRYQNSSWAKRASIW